MYNNSVKIIAEYILYKDRISVTLFAQRTGLSRQTIYRVVNGKSVSARSKHKIIRYYCYLRSVA